MPSGDPFSLSADKRILLHLLRFTAYQDQFQLPKMMSQEGIALAVGIRRPHVSRSIHTLLRQRLVYERKGHIEGAARKRKIYFLTDEGRSQATTLKDSLEAEEIVVKVGTNHMRVRLGNYNELFKKEVPLIDLLKAINDQGIIDGELLDMETREKTRKRRKLLDFSRKAPMLRNFFGRSDEMREIRDWLDEGDGRVVVVTGMAGIGKTTLCLKLKDELSEQHNIFWHRIREWDTLKNLLTPLGEFMARMEKRDLRSYLHDNIAMEVGDILDILQEDLPGSNSVLFFDDFYKSEQRISDFFSLLAAAMGGMTGVSLVILTRQTNPIYIEDEELPNMKETMLRGLDEESSKRLVGDRVQDREAFERLFEVTEGHPLALELITPSSGEDWKGKKDLEHYVREEIYNRLEPEEKEVMERACVHKYPIEKEAFLGNNPDQERRIVDLLVSKSLMEITDEKYSVHEILRGFIYNRLVPVKRIMMEKHAADYYLIQYMSGGSDFHCIALQHHLIMGGEVDRALKIALEKGDELLSAGHAYYMAVLKEFLSEKIAPHSRVNIMRLTGNLYMQWGEWSKAKKQFEMAVEEAHDSGDELGKAKVLDDIGILHSNKEEWGQTKEFHEKALEIYRVHGEGKQAARAYNNMGFYYRNMGDLDRAAKSYGKALQLLTKGGDRKGTAVLYVNFGILHTMMDDHEKALDFFRRALELADQTQYALAKARAYHNMGVLYLKQEDHEDAAKYFRRGMGLFDRLNEHKELSMSHMRLGHLELATGDPEKALASYETSLQLAKKYNYPKQSADAYYELGKMEKGPAKREDLLIKAREIYELLGLLRDVEKVESELEGALAPRA